MKTNISVQNMQCAHCVSTINNNLLKINGVYGLEADVANETISIEHTDGIPLEEILSQLDKLGYPQKNDAFATKAEEWDLNPRRVAMAEKFFKRVVDIIPIEANHKVMDFGCGTGLVGLQFAPYVDNLVMADNSTDMLSVLTKKIANLKLDPAKIKLIADDISKLKDNDIDLIVSLMTFHHINKIGPVIKQFYAKMKTGASVAIGDLALEDGSFHDETVAHNGFDTKEICSLLSDAGFKLSLCEIFNKIEKPTENGVRKFEQFIIIAKK